jgi:hypothetical protein
MQQVPPMLPHGIEGRQHEYRHQTVPAVRIPHAEWRQMA